MFCPQFEHSVASAHEVSRKTMRSVTILRFSAEPVNFLHKTVGFQCGLRPQVFIDTENCEYIISANVFDVIRSDAFDIHTSMMPLVTDLSQLTKRIFWSIHHLVKVQKSKIGPKNLNLRDFGETELWSVHNW